MTKTPTHDEVLALVSAVNAMIGYCSSLKGGTTVTEGYVERMNNHYVPQLEKALAALSHTDARGGGVDEGYLNIIAYQAFMSVNAHPSAEFNLITHPVGVIAGMKAVIAALRPYLRQPNTVAAAGESGDGLIKRVNALAYACRKGEPISRDEIRTLCDDVEKALGAIRAE